jgi:hypothetical protein
MRRTVCVSLILLFWLGPFAAALPATAETRLPACCRRSGAHHCAMPAAMVVIAVHASPGSAPRLTAPAHCSSYPGFMLASTGPIEALITSPAWLGVTLAEPHSPAARRAAARLSELRTRANRGPPISQIG